MSLQFPCRLQSGQAKPVCILLGHLAAIRNIAFLYHKGNQRRNLRNCCALESLELRSGRKMKELQTGERYISSLLRFSARSLGFQFSVRSLALLILSTIASDQELAFVPKHRPRQHLQAYAWSTRVRKQSCTWHRIDRTWAHDVFEKCKRANSQLYILYQDPRCKLCAWFLAFADEGSLACWY